MKIIHPQDVPHVAKPEGTRVTYFLFPEYEVHYNEQTPGSTQLWHHHEKVWETKMGAHQTNKYGATVASVYRRKPWLKK